MLGAIDYGMGESEDFGSDLELSVQLVKVSGLDHTCSNS